MLNYFLQAFSLLFYFMGQAIASFYSSIESLLAEGFIEHLGGLCFLLWSRDLSWTLRGELNSACLLQSLNAVGTLFFLTVFSPTVVNDCFISVEL